MQQSTTRFKRIIALVLAVVLMGGLLPHTGAANGRALAPGEVSVSTEEAFKTALADPTVTTIYFAANIRMTSTVIIAKRPSGSLTICGTDPTSGERYSYTDVNSSLVTAVPLRMNSGSVTSEVVFKDIELYIYNFYGILQFSSEVPSNSALTVVFDGVSGVASQFMSLGYSNLVIKNSRLEVKFTGGSNAEEVADIANLRLEGRVELLHNLTDSSRSNGYSFFNFSQNVDHTVTIADGAHVTAETGYNLFGMFHFFSNVGGRANLTMGKDATLSYIGTDRFSVLGDYGRFNTFTIGERSTVSINVPQSSSNGAYLWANTVNVGRGASLSIRVHNNFYSALRTTRLNLDAPRRVEIVNAGSSGAVSSDIDVSLKATGLKSIRYYTSAANFAADSYSRWFFMRDGEFALDLSRWGASSATIGSTTYVNDGSYAALTGANIGASGTKAVRIDGAYSSPPTLDRVTEGDKTVSGTGIAGAKITISSPATGTLYAVVGSDGRWTAESTVPFVRDQTVSATQSEPLYGYDNVASAAVTTKVLRMPLSVTANSTEKSYVGDMPHVLVSVADASSVKVDYIIFNDPDHLFSTDDAALFAAGDSRAVPVTKNPDGDYTASLGRIDYNCVVWVRATVTADGKSTEFFDAVVYRNLFTPYRVEQRGTTGAVTLYGYAAVGGTYGLPYIGDGATVYGNPLGGFDTVRLELDARFSRHYTATAGGNAAPYTLTLDGSFLTNSVCDGGNPARYTLQYSKIADMWRDVDIVFVSGWGEPLAVDGAYGAALSVPLTEQGGAVSENFHALGGRYTPPEDDTCSPVGWYVGASFSGGEYNETSGFGSFNPEFTDVNSEKLFIIYKTGQYRVTERYHNTNGDTLHSENSLAFDPQSAMNYVGIPERITGYVPIGYTVTGSSGADIEYTFNFATDVPFGTSPTTNQYDLFPALVIAMQYLAPSGAGEVMVTFIYAADADGNGIADSEQATVTVKWHGFNAGSAAAVELNPSAKIETRVGYDITVTAEDAISVYDLTWLLDTALEGNTAQRTVTATDGATVEFIYGAATDGVTLDRLQYAIEEIYELDGAPLAEPRTRYVLKTQKYEWQPPAIDGYVYVGYRVTDESSGDTDGNVITYLNGAQPQAVSLNEHPERFVVTLLYRRAAAPVTVRWTGTTYAGNTVEFGAVTRGGYVGEVVTIYAYEVWTGDSWKQVGTHRDSIEFTLGEQAQSDSFAFKEATNDVSITVIYRSDDGNINFLLRNSTIINGAPIAVTAFNLIGYELSGWMLTDSQGSEISSGGSGNLPATVNPSLGSQTLVVEYRSTLTALYVRCFDAQSGQEIDGTSMRIDDVRAGSLYAVPAPAVSGYELADGEPLIKTAEVGNGITTMTFSYNRITGGTLVLREAGDSDRIIAYKNLDTAIGEQVDVPDLEPFYYRALSDAQSYQGETLVYYYEKEMINVQLRAVDADSESVLDTTTLSARRGEMLRAAAGFDIAGWLLDDEPSKLLFADNANGDTITVDFTYRRVKTGDVTVSYRYTGDDGAEHTLKTLTLSAPLGTTVTAMAEMFEGFELAQGEAAVTTIAVSEGANEIVFRYTDVRKTVDVNYYIADEDEPSLVENDTFRFAANGETSRRVALRAFEGYVADGYTIDGGEYIPLRLGSVELELGVVTGDMNVDVYYKSESETVGGYFVNITVRGIDRAGNRLFSYVITRPRDGGAAHIEALVLNGYAAANDSATVPTDGSVTLVEFVYDSLRTVVEIRAELDGGGEVPGYTTVFAPATIGHGFSFNAPYIAGYYLVGAVTQTIGSVSDGETLTFLYRKAEYSAIITLKEDNADGRVIKTVSADGGSGEPVTLDAPDLTQDGYTLIGPQSHTVAYAGSAIKVEFYYTKNLVSVTVRAVDVTGGGSQVLSETVIQCRDGEAAHISAPPVSGAYRPIGEMTRTVIARDGEVVVFEYESTAPDEVFVTAVDTDGTPLVGYSLTGTTGDTLYVRAIELFGYKLVEGHSAFVQVAVPGSVQFVYERDTVTITLRFTDAASGERINPPADVQTEFETARGSDFTAYAPHLAGYVVYGSATRTLSGVAQNTEIEFRYEPLPTTQHTTVTIRAVDADGMDIIEPFRVGAIAGNVFTFNAPDLHRLTGSYYYLIDQSPLGIVDNAAADGSSEIVFTYGIITGGIVLVAREDDAAGRVIAVYAVGDAPDGEPMLLTPPDLSGEYYDYTGGEVWITPDAANGVQTVELFYHKRLVDVEVKAVSVGVQIASEVYRNARMGEAAYVTAPEVEGYRLDDANIKSVLALDGAEVVFEYAAEIVNATLRVSITSSLDGKAVTGAKVTVTHTEVGTQLSGATDTSGIAVFDGAEFGEYAVAVAAAGYQSGYASVAVDKFRPVSEVYVALGKVQTGGGGNGGDGGGTTEPATSSLVIIGVDQNGDRLYTETLTKTVGDVVTVTARTLDGYTLDDAATKKITIATLSDENVITFRYVKDETNTLLYELITDIAYINGYTDGTVHPDAFITRAEAAMVFFRLIKDSGKHNPLGVQFTDIRGDEWFAQAASYLQTLGIITGYTDGTFGPSGLLTRAEFAAIVSRFTAKKDGGKTFSDVSDTHWAYGHIQNAAAHGWVTGYPDGSFRPNGKLTRAEFVTVVNAMLGRDVKPASYYVPLNPYTDIDETHWAFAGVIEASLPR